MIQRAGNMDVGIREQMRGGKGPIEIRSILKQDQLKGKCRMFSKIVIKPGCSIGLHKHEEEEEIFYILEGEGLVDDNGTKQTVRAGDAMLTGDGAAHSIENTGTEDLELMAVILLY